MSRIKMGVVAIAAVFVVSAVASSMASAATAGWMVNGSNLAAGATKALATTGKVTEKGTFTGAGATIKCEGSLIKGEEPKISGTSSGEAKSVIFTECESVTENCKTSPSEIGTVPVVVTELTLDGSLAVKGAFLPKTKNTFATIKYEGTACALTGVLPVTGKVKFLAPEGQDEKSAQPVKISTETGDLKIASSEATLKGAGELKLASGEPWSYL